MKRVSPPQAKRSHKAKTARSQTVTAAHQSDESFPIVGIGASAGGLEAFTQLLQHLPVDTGMGFVLVQHLDPVHESALTALLAKATVMPVREVTNDMPVKPNHVYVIPPNTNLAIAQGVLKLQPRKMVAGAHHSIDFFFESLAHDQRECAIGVILSGTATDGTLGLETIKGEGGIAFAQDDSAKYDSMPRNAIAAGCVDFVLSPQKIAKELTRVARHPYVGGARKLRPLLDAPELSDAEGRGEDSPTQHSDGEGFKKILLLLRNHSGVDFSLYKTNTIHRRITRRMVLNKKETFDGYANFLRGNAKELDALYSDALISVTSFFRNPEVFELLKRKVFPALLQARRGDPIRIWVLGCSTGQEAYSIAMAFSEFSETTVPSPNLQIFATDLNEPLLERARHGFYSKNLVQNVSPNRLRRFFVEESGGYRITKALREMCIFARQNLISDPPFSRMDIISCRNLMIYLEASLQRKLLPTFHYSLKPQGFLVLGASESIGSFGNLFEPIDKKQKIFARKNVTTSFHLPMKQGRDALKPGSRPRPAPARDASREAIQPQAGFHDELNAQREADRLTVNQFAPPGVLINDELDVLQFRGPTRAFLTPSVGKATFNILKMAGEGLMLPLRAAINKAKKEGQRVRKENIRIDRDGGERAVNIEVIPLKNLKQRCYLILFEEAQERGVQPVSTEKQTKKLPAPRQKQTPKGTGLSADHLRRIIELEHELSDTREYLQTIQEQHEAATEELQASSEEVQSSNEELQSINEELETSKEELESTNEELTTVNEEMANRNQELTRANSDLLNLQNSVHTAIVVLGRDLSIRRFTPLAEKSFNLSAGDIGRPINNIRVNFDFPDLEQWITNVIKTASIQEREVLDRQGKWYSLRARPYLTLDNKIDGAVLMLVDINDLKHAEEVAEESSHYTQAIVEDAPPLLVLDQQLRVISSNKAFYDHFKVSPAQTEQCLVYELGNGQWNIPELRRLLEDILPRHSFFKDFEITHEFETIGRRTMLVRARRLDSLHLILLFITDITERVESQARVRASELRYRRLFESARDGILILDGETRKITESNPEMAKLLGYPREEFIGKELWELGLLKDEEASKVAFRALRQKGFLRYEDLPLQIKDGGTIQVEFVSNIYHEGNDVVVQCNIRDITERKRAAQDLKEAKEQIDRHAANLEKEVAERTAKLRDSIKSLESLTYTLAHDLRAPIRAMKQFTVALLEDVPLDQTGKEYAGRINQAAERMDQLVNDLLEYGQLSHLEFPTGALDLKTEIESTLVELTNELESTNAEVVVQEPFPTIVGNETLLRQVLSNLILNAVTFVAGVRPKVLLRAETRGPMVRLWVEDNGIGVAPQYQERIFGIFQRLHMTSEFPGTGVGLAIVKRAVERMGGSVGVTSEPGKGSQFWFEVPKANSAKP